MHPKVRFQGTQSARGLHAGFLDALLQEFIDCWRRRLAVLLEGSQGFKVLYCPLILQKQPCLFLAIHKRPSLDTASFLTVYSAGTGALEDFGRRKQEDAKRAKKSNDRKKGRHAGEISPVCDLPQGSVA
jgi:hypothetical protein